MPWYVDVATRARVQQKATMPVPQVNFIPKHFLSPFEKEAATSWCFTKCSSVVQNQVLLLNAVSQFNARYTVYSLTKCA